MSTSWDDLEPISTPGERIPSPDRGTRESEAAEAIASAPETFGRIAVCLDGSETGECVLAHARAIAQALGGSITLLRVLEDGSAGEAPPDPLAWEIRRRETREYLERAAAHMEAEPPIDVCVIEGKAAEEICLWTRRNDVGLTVLCSHGLGGPTSWSLASTARKLVERASGPFLLVPTAAGVSEPVASYRRLLVPVDGSGRAESVLPLAKRLTHGLSAELLLAHVVPVPELTEIGPLDTEDLELRERVERRNERVANAYLDRLRAELSGDDGRVRALVLRGGDARVRLLRVIEDEDVDLVVLSARGRRARADLSLGSVASCLVENATRPLLIVRRAPELPGARRASGAEPRAVSEDVRLPSQATS